MREAAWRSGSAAAGRYFDEDRDRAVEPARIDVERHRAARRVERAFHPAVQVECRIGEIGDAHAIECDARGIELERSAHALDIDAGERGAPDIDHQRHIARAFDRAAVERRARERQHAIDIEFAGLEFRVEAWRLRAVRARIGETALDGLAVELELEAARPRTPARRP